MSKFIVFVAGYSELYCCYNDPSVIANNNRCSDCQNRHCHSSIVCVRVYSRFALYGQHDVCFCCCFFSIVNWICCGLPHMPFYFQLCYFDFIFCFCVFLAFCCCCCSFLPYDLSIEIGWSSYVAWLLARASTLCVPKAFVWQVDIF